MKRVYVNYYNSFQCIADRCPKTCCAGWQIEIDEASLQRYRDQGIVTVDYEEECFLQDMDKNCANLDERGLCKLILEHGEDILCQTCRMFPRHVEEFEGVREYSLSISCPEVARMVLESVDPVGFTTYEDGDVDEESYDPQEQVVAEHLHVLRAAMIPYAKERQWTFAQRAVRILELAQMYQEELDQMVLDGEDLATLDVEELIQEAWEMDERDEEGRALALNPKLHETIYAVMKEWEYTGNEFEQLVLEAEEILANQEEATLLEAEQTLRQQLQAAGIHFDVVLEQILVYFLYAYFCGACYDEYYYGQAQLAVAACLHIQDFCIAKIIKQGQIAMSDVIRYTYLYARELEHSIPNVLATEAYMDEHPLI